MKNGKELTTKQRILRFLGLILLGGVAGGIIGGLAGYFTVEGWRQWTDFLNIANLLWVTRGLVILILLFSLFFLLQARSYHTRLQQAEEAEDDDLIDQIYPKNLRYLEYATILVNIALTLTLFNILLGMNFYVTSNGAEVNFPLLDYGFLILLVSGQVLFYKTIEKIRDYKLSAFPTVNEIKAYVYSMDEGEQQANFEQAFVTVFNLNQRVLPALYVIVFFIEMLFQTKQLVAYAVILIIHIYINVTQYQMVRRYFK